MSSAPQQGSESTGIPPAPPVPGVGKRLLRRPLALAGLVVILVVVVLAVAAPLVAPYDPAEQHFEGLTLEGAPLPPNAQFLLGTDLLGRDLFSRLLFGGRTSLFIGVIANGAAVAIGALVGITAGFFGGFIGAALMRFTDLMAAFPALLACRRPRRAFPSQPLDRRARHCHGELGAAQPDRLYPDTFARRARVHRGGARDRRQPHADICFSTSCRIFSRSCWYGARSASRSRCCLRRR